MKNSISTTLYIAASLTALFGVALLVVNIFIFKSTLDQYITEGYPAETVLKGLLTQQLLPGIFEPIAVYGGIAFILIGIGNTNKKISKCLLTLVKGECQNESADDSITEENIDGSKNIKIIEQTETL
jgi:hypothetical protein